MRRAYGWLVAAVIVLSLCDKAAAERLEVGLAITPTVLQDGNYEAFSEADLYALRFGLDLKSEIASVGGFELVPLISYRIAFDGGEPYRILDTNLTTHDFLGGLRVRRDLVSWLAVFVEAVGGLLWAEFEGSISLSGYEGYGIGRRDYTDRRLTWQAGGLAGAEVGLSERWLETRGITRFGFSGEIAGGYLRRGDTEFAPELEAGDEFALPVADAPNLGEINLSGWVIQVAASFKFF
jgi:hypothetical protein